MELLQKFKDNGYFTAELYHLLANKKMMPEALSDEIIPSDYVKEMKMSTKERLQTLNSIEIDNLVTTGGKMASNVVLSFTPKLLVFQNFKPNEKIVTKFVVKNISKAPTFVNMVFKESSYFAVKQTGMQSRLAPGIGVTFTVTFMPVQYEDYTHKAIFYTDSDEYILPLIGMGPRPLFDFPDEIIIPKTPLKMESDYFLSVHNVGVLSAGFTLNTRVPFSARPKSAYLAPKEDASIKVGLKTMRLGETEGFLYVVLETGERFRIKLFGSTYTVNIELEKQVVRFLETYNTMVRQLPFKIINKSDKILSYMCLKNENLYRDFEDKLKLATICFDLKESESAKYSKLVQYDVLTSDEHQRVYTRIFYDEIHSIVADEKLQYQNTHFSITPIHGFIWPNQTTELTITFSPKEIGDLETLAFLDVDGIPNRIPLKLKGTSLPPSVDLSVDTLDMDNVYINKTYNYEVVAINKGLINGVILYKGLTTLFGSNIACTPEMHCLRPGDKEIFVISFSNSNQGPFFEELLFSIRETDVVRKLYLKGTVVYPSVTFSMPSLDFGDVSIGIPTTLNLEIINESVVNIAGTVKIAGDGPEVSSIILADCDVPENPKLDFPNWPREFQITPKEVEIGPQSSITLEVTLIANLVRPNHTFVELELEKSSSPPIVLPVTFDAKVPILTPASDTHLHLCFLNFDYVNEIIIETYGHYGYFTIEEPPEGSSFKLDVDIKRGLIEPNSTLKLTTVFSTSVLGEQEYTLRMFLFGVTNPIDIWYIKWCGAQPIVTNTPLSLQWGQVKLLEKTDKTLTLFNDSPVSVNYRTSLLHRDGRWTITPSEGTLEPESEEELVLTVCLIDADLYKNKAVIHVENVKDIFVPLSATGVGTSIVVSELADRIELGLHFTKLLMRCKVPIKNCGTRIHMLEWNEYYKNPKPKNPAPNFFTLDPRNVKVLGEETIELTITALTNKVGVVQETWFLMGVVEGINKRELLLECPITAEFLDPKIEVSATTMSFRYDFGPYSEYYKLTDIMTIKNVSRLPLNIDIKVKQPFAIVKRTTTYKISLPEDEDTCCCVYYRESDLNVRKIKDVYSLRKERAFLDFLTLRPVQPLREGSLHFFEDIDKIKMAFNLTNSLEEHLEDQEAMKIQIVFDTTKHDSLQSKIYTELLSIKFRGHKNKDAVKLIGKVNYPNMHVMTPKVDFGCIQNGSIESKCMKMQNHTPLMTCYKFKWREYNIKSLPTPDIHLADICESPAKVSTDDTNGTQSEITHDVAMMVPPVSEVEPETEILDPQIVPEQSEVVEMEDPEVKQKKIMKKITPMLDLDIEEEFGWTNKLPHIIKDISININDIFQLTPHRGLLKTNDVQFVHVIFRPPNNISVEATLECEVLGGPSEFIKVTGQSADLMYSLNTTKINFKIRSFHEDAIAKLILTNISALPFEYKTYLNEPEYEDTLKATIKHISPAEAILQSEEEVAADVVVRPGSLGYFSRTFYLEIGHLPYLSIEAFGWGQIPQIYLSLPRITDPDFSEIVGYKAISALTREYLDAIAEYFYKSNSEHLNSPLYEKCFEDPLFEQDWHICSSWDGLPSLMDINLAIERKLVVYHIRDRPELLSGYTAGTRTGPIPGFKTTPYIIDFGVVITNTTVSCVADVINYGPLTSRIRVTKATREYPPWYVIKLPPKLHPGEVGKLEVNFSPVARDFPENEQSTEIKINLEVPYGVTIPITIKAQIAVPYLTSTIDLLDFGSVRCGDKVTVSLPLLNVGKPSCIWHVTLKVKTSGHNPITMNETSGKYDPKEGGYLHLAFQPTVEMIYEGALVFRFYMNPDRLVIPVVGQGLMPQVHVIGPQMTFPPTLPWAPTTELYFGLTNPCTFPIELIFPHCDRQWKDEEEILQLLDRYYDKPAEILVPTVKPGAGWPSPIMAFYESYTHSVKKELGEESESRPSSSKIIKKPAKSPRGQKAKDVPSKVFRSESEVATEVIQNLKCNDEDPLKQCLEGLTARVSVETDSKSKGLIVFVHASPAEEMQCQEIAYSIGKKLKLPTVNVDSCVIDALTYLDNNAQQQIMGILNDFYDGLIVAANKELTGDHHRPSTYPGTTGDSHQRPSTYPGVTGDTHHRPSAFPGFTGDTHHRPSAFPGFMAELLVPKDETEDAYDVVKRKLELFASNKGPATPRSRKPTSITNSHSGLKMGSTTMFQSDLLQELLTEYFTAPKFSRGFIVDSLTSVVFKNPTFTLTCLLKCKLPTNNLHLLLCQSDFSKWAEAYEARTNPEVEVVEEPEPKEYTEEEIQEIIQLCEEMDEEEYTNASEEQKTIYIQHGLEQRRIKYYKATGRGLSSQSHATAVVVPGPVKKKEKDSKVDVKSNADQKKKSKKEDSGKGKPPPKAPEYVIMCSKYHEYYKNTYDALVNISVNWIIEAGELGVPLYSLSGNLVASSQKKSKTKKSDINLASQGSQVDIANRGFPLTLITCPCTRFREGVVNMFVDSPFIQAALEEEVKDDNFVQIFSKNEYTMLLPKTMPVLNVEDTLQWMFLDEPAIRKCECTQTTDLDIIDDSNQDYVINILSKWHCVCGKKLASSQTSTSAIPSVSVQNVVDEESQQAEEYARRPMPLRTVNAVEAFHDRLVLKPGDLVRCKFLFNPQVEGTFTIKQFVEVSGWPDSRIDITCSGICDLPRLDNRPKKMFPHFVRRTVEDKVYKKTYLDDQKRFEFGPIFIGYHRLYEEQYTIDLKNSSLLKDEIEIEFQEDIATEVFNIDKSFMELEAGERGKLTIYAAPDEIGEFDSNLLLCVNGNPDIIECHLTCTGIVPIIKVLPDSRIIDFGKHLLYRREDDRFILKNDSVLPVMWKIRNASEFVEDFIISQTSGIIESQDNHVVPITYIACNVKIIKDKSLILDIYDERGRGPMLTDSLHLTAECYDVMVDCLFQNFNDSFLNFGNVKVNSTVSQEMYLCNRGHYPIYFKLKKVKNFPEPGLLRTFTATSYSGTLPPNAKNMTVKFDCTPTYSMSVSNVPAFICSLMDGTKEQVVVAKFPVCASIDSFYNTFTLYPLGELNFDIHPVDATVTREVILSNTSKCPFTYEIVLPESCFSPDDPPPPPEKKSRDNKLRIPPQKCGPFYIMNEDNLLAPGTSRTIPIVFMPLEPKTFAETVKFIISDVCPAEVQGVPLRLVGTCAVPRLDFWNIENTFREHLIVKNIKDYTVHETTPHCVFVEDSVVLHFFCVAVNTSHAAAIYLYNEGQVPCDLGMKMQYQSNTSPDILFLDKSDTVIEPLSYKKLVITFAPKHLEEYRAVITIRQKSLENATTEQPPPPNLQPNPQPTQSQYKLCVVGEGVIPRIWLLQPQPRQHKLALLQFPVTCLGSVTSKAIRFKNITSIKTYVMLVVMQPTFIQRPVFWLNTVEKCDHMLIEGSAGLLLANSFIALSSDLFDNLPNIPFALTVDMNTTMKLMLKPHEIASLKVYFNPIIKGRTSCDVKITIDDNLYEYYTIMCEAEAFMEDIILLGLEMLSMDVDVDAYKASSDMPTTTASTIDSRKKTKSAPVDKKKRASKKISVASIKLLETMLEAEYSGELKYVLDFGGCELRTAQKRTVIMVNNSEKVYKFAWLEVDNIIIKPSVGYISPGEEKDFEIIFFSAEPLSLKRAILNCSLVAISDDILTIKGPTWDNRQTVTLFDQTRESNLVERCESLLDEQTIPASENVKGNITVIIFYSVTTEYTTYTSTLPEEITLEDTFVYQSRVFDFTVDNTGNVPLKIRWSFSIDDEYPKRIDKCDSRRKDSTDRNGDDKAMTEEDNLPEAQLDENQEDSFKESLFSGSVDRESVDTWFEIELPFKIDPEKACLKPHEKINFKVIFSPLEAFDFKVRLKSSIDNLDPYDQNMCCKIMAKSLIPYVHLDIEESQFLDSDIRKSKVLMPHHTQVLEFNVLGAGCYKRKFNVINPTTEGYEFIFEHVDTEKESRHKKKAKDMIPVHCNTLKGYLEGGTSTEVTFTFSPAGPGVYESQWRLIISAKPDLVTSLLVAGIVREPSVVFDPTILILKNCIVGFGITTEVLLKNNEAQSFNFEFKGNSLVDIAGCKPVHVLPEKGVLKPNSAVPIKIDYRPVTDGPVTFKIFCKVQLLEKLLTLCVHGLSQCIEPKVNYYLIGNEHTLESNAETNIHLDQTASSYERQIPFTIHNKGSATFTFEWEFECEEVKKYLTVFVEPKCGSVTPGESVQCIAHFTLIQVPVIGYPVKLKIIDGPEYSIFLHAEIEKPKYRFSAYEINFGKCIINAPDNNYIRNLCCKNDDDLSIVLCLDFETLPELSVDFKEEAILPKERAKIPIYFRPKEIKEYEIKLTFWVNSLCQEVVTIRGEGVPLLIDIYEGCQKSFDLGPIKVGLKAMKSIEVMNHSKVTVSAKFGFNHLYKLDLEEVPDDVSEGSSTCLEPSAHPTHSTEPSRVKQMRKHIEQVTKHQHRMDAENALHSMKVIPHSAKLKPYEKVKLKVYFKPVGLISDLQVQLYCKVMNYVRPLVNFSGSATGMSLRLSQNSMQFGQVRKRGCKVMKFMLHNDGDFGAKFLWEPLKSDDFKISPMHGNIASRTNVTFTITFRPLNHNPFIKVWASCNIENYKALELAMYGNCVDTSIVTNKSMYLECPVREVITDRVVVTNPTDQTWVVFSKFAHTGPFETIPEFSIPANSTFEIPITFKPKIMGNHEAQVLFSPLDDSALFVTILAEAMPPNPNANINLCVGAKTLHTESLNVYNITENPEWYVVTSEMVHMEPPHFNGYYEVKHMERLKVWGEAKATCHWLFQCYEPCEMSFKVMFTNEESREYQYYILTVDVTPSDIVDCLTFTCRARESVQRDIVVRNPLSTDETFYVISPAPAQLQCPETVFIAKNSQATIPLVYSPIVVGETLEYLSVANTKTGSYVYRVTMNCTPAKEKDLEYTASLGTSIPIRLRIPNKTPEKVDFITTVSHPCIILMEKDYVLTPNEKGKLQIWFEPTELGVQYCQLVFSSPIAGDFVFNIKGVGTEPKPQGPFEIPEGGSRTIKFKNVFPEVCTFKIDIDNEEFFVKTHHEEVKAKKDLKLVVYLNDRHRRDRSSRALSSSARVLSSSARAVSRSGSQIERGPHPVGCLTIETHEPPEPKVHWTYFLQGI